jgi:hypothetical protein
MGILDKITDTFGKSKKTVHSRHSQPQRTAATSLQDNENNKTHLDKAHRLSADSQAICSRSINLGMEPTTLPAHHRQAPLQNKPDKPIGDGNTMQANDDGSYIVVDSQGNIVRTFDVLGVKREFARDKYTGKLMVKRFGTWSKPQAALLEPDGTLSYSADGVDVVERLNGVHMHRQHDSNVTIITDHPNKVEIVKNPNGEITKRTTTQTGETFGIWRDAQLRFLSETFYEPRRHEALTPNGPQPLVYVSRAERRILRPDVMQEKFFFRNPLKNERHVTLSLQFATGLLMLKGVVSVASIIHADVASEATFELKQAVTLRADLPGYKGSIENVMQVRLFDDTNNIGVAFKNVTDKEYIVMIPKTELGFAQTLPAPAHHRA